MTKYELEKVIQEEINKVLGSRKFKADAEKCRFLKQGQSYTVINISDSKLKGLFGSEDIAKCKNLMVQRFEEYSDIVLLGSKECRSCHKWSTDSGLKLIIEC